MAAPTLSHEQEKAKTWQGSRSVSMSRVGPPRRRLSFSKLRRFRFYSLHETCRSKTAVQSG
jgi:hypothetical protein